MIERLRPSFGREPKRSRSQKGRSGWFFALGLAILLFFVSTAVYVTHTCTPYRLAFSDPLVPPCPACLLLQALHATRIALLSFDLPMLNDCDPVTLPQLSPVMMEEACLGLIRAPPAGGFDSIGAAIMSA